MSRQFTAIFVDQLDFYLQAHLLPRLEGLTDAEYFWEPVADCWSVRPDGSGGWRMDEATGDTDDVDHVTTIAWRLTHIAISNLGTRANAYFGPLAGDDVDMFDPRYVGPVPGSADDAVAALVDSSTRWREGVAGLDDDQLAAAIGPKGGPFANDPFGALVAHVSRETMHHGGEIGLLRDLHRESFTAPRRGTSSSPAAPGS
jgi:hypothetical protein